MILSFTIDSVEMKGEANWPDLLLFSIDLHYSF